jgi:teichuronic acid biosynthesis glycosyltransferase TuaC
VSTAYPTPWEPTKGPANRSTVESLRLVGCDVRVVAPVPWTRRVDRPSPLSPIERYPIFWYPPGILRGWYHITMGWSIATALNDACAGWRPDAVLAYWTDPDGTVAIAHARTLGVPGAIIAGGSDVMLLAADPRRRQRIAATLAAADHVFAVGSVLQHKVIELGASPGRVSNFVSGVDLTRFHPGDRRAARERLGLAPTGPLLLWIGNMVPVKAAERVLQAAALLTTAFPGLSVALAGGGPQRAALHRHVDLTPGLRGRVTFSGPVDHATLPDWYRAADLFVLPSRSEGVPNVLLEAMSCGLPFVASDVGSIRDLLPFHRSRVVPEGDVPALADAIAVALGADPHPVMPRGIDRLAGARHLLDHLGLATVPD